ncbi:response regulator [Tsuneonella rigui]|uniref:response regulator n=1 Tax=Tsuneonella rigui TaxID=1708790 RepID=UPI0013DEEBD5|nr:response regulator [Tsuneonella rigui]
MTLAGLKILVVEDEPIIAMVLEELLEDERAIPTVASSLEQADDALVHATFDAAILDINVHGQKSYSIAAVLLQRGVPFVFASGYGDTLNPDEFAHVPTVTKPYDLPTITRALFPNRG